MTFGILKHSNKDTDETHLNFTQTLFELHSGTPSIPVSTSRMPAFCSHVSAGLLCLIKSWGNLETGLTCELSFPLCFWVLWIPVLISKFHLHLRLYSQSIQASVDTRIWCGYNWVRCYIKNKVWCWLLGLSTSSRTYTFYLNLFKRREICQGKVVFLYTL